MIFFFSGTYFFKESLDKFVEISYISTYWPRLSQISQGKIIFHTAGFLKIGRRHGLLARQLN